MIQPSPPRPGGSQWILAFLIGFSLVAFISLISLVQVTSSSAGSRLLANTVAMIADIDAALPGIETSLRESAEQGAQDPITVPNFPIPVQIARDEALTITGVDLRDRILTTSGDALYNDGVSVWANADSDARQQIGRRSTAGAVRLGIGLVGDTQHTVFLVLAVVAGLATLVFAATLAMQLSTLRRLVTLGAIVTASAVPALLVALLVRVALPSLGGGQFTDDLVDIAVDAESVAVRNFLIVSLLGFAVGAAGFAGMSMDTRAEQAA
ncbi:MAG: hypothetical protein IH957_06705 [Chloroflexi bacterium]|nr:hypothetical protein [Chloroflexota bacterium]